MRRRNRVQGCGRAKRQAGWGRQTIRDTGNRESSCTVLTGYKYKEAGKVNRWRLRQKCSTGEERLISPSQSPLRSSVSVRRRGAMDSQHTRNVMQARAHQPARRGRRWRERGPRGRTAGSKARRMASERWKVRERLNGAERAETEDGHLKLAPVTTEEWHAWLFNMMAV